MSEIETQFFENLSSVDITCPHQDSFSPDGIRIYYRVLKTNEVTSESFSPTEIKANRPIPSGFDMCIGMSVSIYDDLQGMINGFFKLPSNKGKKKHIGVLKLQSGDGMLKQTFDNKNHHSWWRSKSFDIETVTINEIAL
jgi:hypothetical protein